MSIRPGKGQITAEIREKALPRGTVLLHFRELHVEVLKTQIKGMAVNLIEFISLEGAVQGFVLLSTNRPVLRHETDRQVGPEFNKERGESIEGVLSLSREDEMANQHAFSGQSASRKGYVQKTLLANHFINSIEGDHGIIGGAG